MLVATPTNEEACYSETAFAAASNGSFPSFLFKCSESKKRCKILSMCSWGPMKLPNEVRTDLNSVKYNESWRGQELPGRFTPSLEFAWSKA